MSLLLETKTIKWEDLPEHFTNKPYTLVDTEAIKHLDVQSGEVIEDNVDDNIMEVDDNIDFCNSDTYVKD